MFSQLPLKNLMPLLLRRLVSTGCIGLAGDDVNAVAVAHRGTALLLRCQQLVDQSAVSLELFIHRFEKAHEYTRACGERVKVVGMQSSAHSSYAGRCNNKPIVKSTSCITLGS